MMTVNLAASTYGNVAAIPDQKRTITLLSADELLLHRLGHPTNGRNPGMSVLTEEH